MDKFEELLVNKGLYSSIDISEEDLDMILSLYHKAVLKKFKIDCYCTQCEEKRTFESVEAEVDTKFKGALISVPIKNNIFDDTLEKRYQGLLGNRYSVSFRCTRNADHILLFDLFATTTSQLLKIGQYPSYADISVGNLNKYKSVLRNEFSEFKKSIGLYSHGIGVGSFVYLRRIIETLVINEYEINKLDINVTDEEFKRQEFKEKIKTVSKYLPKVLSNNGNIYSILSKGIHELKEEECLDIFPIMQMAIELILDDIISKREKDEKERMLTGFLANKINEIRTENK